MLVDLGSVLLWALIDVRGGVDQAGSPSLDGKAGCPKNVYELRTGTCPGAVIEDPHLRGRALSFTNV